MVAYVLDPATQPNTQEINETSAENDDAEALKVATNRLDRLLDKLEIGYCDKIVRRGDTVATLLDIINEEQVDLVVMGTHHSQEPPSLVRSITAAVVANTECDVLVLHK
jgi:nucleotide-binding universal stress UspA family protein